MGQVPPLHYGIIGDGRMARHMARYLGLLGCPVTAWSRKFEKQTGVSVHEQFSQCNVILTLISDDAIVPFLSSMTEKHPSLSEKKWLHFSGALVTPLCSGFHPLMTFGKELYDLTTYSNIPFICEANGPKFSDIFPHLPNPSFQIPPELKTLYHSLCVISGNFTVILWQKLFQDFAKKIGIPIEAAFPYLRQIARNIEAHPEAALTGPLQRGDTKTITANLSALEGDPFQEIYTAFLHLVQNERKSP